MTDKHGIEYTPHGTPIIPDGEFRCTCGLVWNLHAKIQVRPTARPVHGHTAVIPKPGDETRKMP